MADAPFEHAEQARLALRTIVAEHGPDMLSRPRALANLLADLMPDAPRIARILVAAAEDRVADDLREHTADGMDIDTASRLVAAAFTSATLIAADACSWAVAEFALAIGLISEPDGVAAGAASVASSTTARFGHGSRPADEPASTQPYDPEDDLSAPTPAPVRPSPRRDPHGLRRPAPIKAPFPVPPEPEAEPEPRPEPEPELAEVGASAMTALDPGIEAAAQPDRPEASVVTAEPEAAPPAPPEPAEPEPVRSRSAASETRPRSQASWFAVVTADRKYFEAVLAEGHLDAATIEFPAYCPERRFQLSGTEMRIGRRSRSRKLEPEIDLTGPPTDPGISHLHAAFVAAPDGTWSVLDRGSANGTQVNGREITEGEPVELSDGDRVCLGAWTTLTVRTS